MREPLTIMQHRHGESETTTYTVEAWPRELVIDPAILDGPIAGLLSVSGDEVTFTVENGRATYRIDRGEHDSPSLGHPAYLVNSRLSDHRIDPGEYEILTLGYPAYRANARSPE